MRNEEFFGEARDGRGIEVDVGRRVARVEVEEGGWREWGFELSEMEYRLALNQGLTESFKRFDRAIFKGLMGQEEKGQLRKGMEVLELNEDKHSWNKEMDW